MLSDKLLSLSGLCSDARTHTHTHVKKHTLTHTRVPLPA